MFKVCGHCDKTLGAKAYKEHRRRYFHDGSWMRTEFVDTYKESSPASSDESSPISTMSDPPSDFLSSDQDRSESEDESVESSISFNSGLLNFDGNVSDSASGDNIEKPPEFEYWKESDDEIEDDIQDCELSEPNVEDVQMDSQQAGLDSEQASVVWWVVTFTCTLQSLHSLSLRAVEWLLKFFVVLLTFLGRYSSKISDIARAIPSTLFLRTKYIREKVSIPPIFQKVACRNCHSLYKYEDCIEKSGTITLVKSCIECGMRRKRTPLLKTIVTCSGTTRYYPFLLYPFCSLISTLQSLLLQPGFLGLCEEWRGNVSDHSVVCDVYSGKVWHEFMIINGQSFLASQYNLAFMLNIDWFQPYKHRTYAVGVMYLAIMNLPRNIRFKRENIILLGLIPGPKEPSLTINTYLTPHISDLLRLWDGVNFNTHNQGWQNIRGALLCIACDLPAARKLCGFLGHAANLGCSRCYCNFGTGVFGQQDFSGFERVSWLYRSNQQHRKDIQAILECSTKTTQKQKESEFGCRYSCLLQLPYFDPVRMTIIDPMHNLYQGTAKSILGIWIDRQILDHSSCTEINKRISSVVIPSNVRFAGIPSTIESTSLFTAEQMMIWVNYYSMFCLYGLLPDDHLECWRHFVLASRLLSKRCMTETDIVIADALLLTFCRHFQRIYGPRTVTPNIHMHCHLVECVKDFGPMNSFWLFSFERYNGILGDKPTNNRAIESQLLKRFVEENFNLQLLLTADISGDAGQAFSSIVKEHALGVHSLKHHNTEISEAVQSTSSKFEFVPASKYTIGVFQEYQLDILKNVYGVLYSSLSERLESDDIILPRTYHRMNNVTIMGQRINSGQYVHAKPLFSDDTAPAPTVTVFSDATLHTAKIQHFAVHLFQVDGKNITHAFAIVNWVESHPNKHLLGKPYELWCKCSYVPNIRNSFLPLENITCLLVSSEYELCGEVVLVTVPLL